jgi:hypothetical protein
MTTTNPEANGGQPVLRQEARKALNGRVPLGLAIALAAMSGMLFGYGVRALVADRSCPRHHIMIVREKRLPLQMPAAEGCRGALRLQLLQQAHPVRRESPAPDQPAPNARAAPDQPASNPRAAH